MRNLVALTISCVFSCAAADLLVLPEHLRPDPFGNIVEADRTVAGAALSHNLHLTAARGAFASCHVVAEVEPGTEYTVRVELTGPHSGVEVDVYREWFHRLAATKAYYPDALIPVSLPYRSRLPEPDNRIPSQTAQGFWVDFWIAPGTPPGDYRATASLLSQGKTRTLPIGLTVLAASVPAEDVVCVDHNTYSTSWLARDYPRLAQRLGSGFYASPEFFELIQSFHRVFYEHRGVFHQLGYGHAGKVGPEFAPHLAGSGRDKHITDWDLFDKHYGPLFDGSAFAHTRRGPAPIPFVYLPINPEWPASYLWWGEPGYETEFVNVVSAMERHFRDKGWTHTNFELFFNHKKRYKGFPWDGDEARFRGDLSYPVEYARLLKKAVPADSPVHFVFRADSSWLMERQFKELAGVINFWVCGGGMFSWYPDAPQMLKQRGDIVWIYGGTPVISEPSSHIALNVLRPWLLGVDGYVNWMSTDAGGDPWFAFDGGGTALVYSGDRFGIDAPISCIRLKLERNAVADVTLLASFAAAHAAELLRSEAARRFNGTALKEWWTPRPPLADTTPEDWTNTDIDNAAIKDRRFSEGLDACAWQRVRDYVMELAKEVR